MKKMERCCVFNISDLLLLFHSHRSFILKCKTSDISYKMTQNKKK